MKRGSKLREGLSIDPMFTILPATAPMAPSDNPIFLNREAAKSTN